MRTDVRCDHCNKDVTLGVIWRKVTLDDGRVFVVHLRCLPEFKENLA